MDLIINTDGASRGNPGPAAYGYIIKTADGVILHQEGQTLGETTNNVAEYTGVLRAFEYVNEHYQKKAPHNITLVADSMLVVRQLEGKFKIKNERLKLIFDAIKILEFSLGRVEYKHTLRAGNFIADRLANQALDAKRS
jgi:ribonuclease HI